MRPLLSEELQHRAAKRQSDCLAEMPAFARTIPNSFTIVNSSYIIVYQQCHIVTLCIMLTGFTVCMMHSCHTGRSQACCHSPLFIFYNLYIVYRPFRTKPRGKMREAPKQATLLFCLENRLSFDTFGCLDLEDSVIENREPCSTIYCLDFI